MSEVVITVGVFMCGIAGITLSFWSFISSMLEFHSLLILRTNGAKRLTAVSNITNDALRVIVQGIVAWIGMAAMLGLYDPSPTTLPWWALASALLTVGLMVDRLRRIKVDLLYRDEHPGLRRRSTDMGV